MRRWIGPVVAALAGMLLLCSEGWAESPTERLRGFFTGATRILDDPATERKPEQRLSAIRTILADIFDFRGAAQFSLGPDWNTRTSGERDEFVRLFAGLLERCFIVGIASRVQLGDGIKVSYLDQSIDGVLATVRTTIASKSGLELPFDYRMIDRGGGWAIRDVMIDGVSLAANYRAQFARILQASSYPDLVRQVQAKAWPLVAPADGRAIMAIAPASPAEAMAKESIQARSGEVFAKTPPDLHRHDLPVVVASAPRQQPDAIPMARAPLESAMIHPTDTAKNEAAREEPGPAAPPRERRSQPSRLEAVKAQPATDPAGSTGSYWVQVGAFKNPEAARQLASLIMEQKPRMPARRAVVVGTGSTGTSLARVRVGPFPDRAAATEALRVLQARGYKPFIAETRD